MTLSKSDYMYFLKHPAWLWLKKYEKNKLPPIDENTQDRFDAGHDFEYYVEKLFPNSLKLGFKDYNYDELLPLTQKALQETNTLIQGRFESNNLTCIVDILNKKENGKYDLIEIKSTSHAKPEHNYDLAFQSLVLKNCGIEIEKYYVYHVNTDYVRKGEIEPEKITKITEVTEEVLKLEKFTQQQTQKALEILEQKKMPDLSPKYANINKIPGEGFREWLEVYKYLNPNLDPYSIYFLSSPSAEQIQELEEKGIFLLSEIPDEMALRDRQLVQIQTTRTNERIIDKKKIKTFLQKIKYPIYFLDYETFSSIVPAFDGLKPYGDYPFQYSLHILETPDSELKHAEYLHTQNTNPMPDLLKKLKEDIGEGGTVITWNMGYEKGCNERMTELYPEYNEFLENLNGRIEDLKIPFSEEWFVDKDFFGSASIKNVLPALIPNMNHKNLDVSDGLKARRLWTNTILKGESRESREEIIKNLIDYCTLDTYAMVVIHKFLLDLDNQKSLFD